MSGSCQREGGYQPTQDPPARPPSSAIRWTKHNPWQSGDSKVEPRQDLVEVRMPVSHWQAVLASMDWDMPDLGDTSPRGQVIRSISERCFAAQRQIRATLDQHEI